jgi:hypothetical protein
MISRRGVTFQLETEMTKVIQFSRSRVRNPGIPENIHVDAASPRCSWEENDFASRDDKVSFRRWRLGFIAFYCAAALILSGLVLIADRASRDGQAIASADGMKHR